MTAGCALGSATLGVVVVTGLRTGLARSAYAARAVRVNGAERIANSHLGLLTSGATPSIHNPVLPHRPASLFDEAGERREALERF